MKADLNQKLIDLIDMLKLSEAPIPQEILDKVNSGVFEQIQCGDLWITPHGVWPVNEVPEYLEFYGYENIGCDGGNRSAVIGVGWIFQLCQSSGRRTNQIGRPIQSELHPR
mgnify:CR=1 FL=1